jgi:hypothetical protein
MVAVLVGGVDIFSGGVNWHVKQQLAVLYSY